MNRSGEVRRKCLESLSRRFKMCLLITADSRTEALAAAENGSDCRGELSSDAKGEVGDFACMFTVGGWRSEDLAAV